MFINHANSSLYIGRNGTGMRQTDSMVGTIKYDRREKIYLQSRHFNIEGDKQQASKQASKSQQSMQFD